MRGWTVTEPGRGIAFADLPEPGIAAGHTRVRIAACALNFADLLLIEGKYQEMPEPPFTPGLELAGVVEGADPAGGGPADGTRVAVYSGRGGLAEMGSFPNHRVVPLPEGIGFDEAAALQIAYGTSHVALAHRARLQPGETLLVLGAAGGVGLTAVEIGKLMGARVIACARGAEKLAVAERAGADHLIDSDTEDLRLAVKALGGADVVYDPVGGALFEAAFRATNPLGRILVIGFAGGGVPEIRANHMLVKNIDVLGFYWGAYLKVRPEVLIDSLTQLFAWAVEGRIRPHISHRLPLERAEEGLELLRSRASTGKVVINP